VIPASGLCLFRPHNTWLASHGASPVPSCAKGRVEEVTEEGLSQLRGGSFLPPPHCGGGRFHRELLVSSTPWRFGPGEALGGKMRWDSALQGGFLRWSLPRPRDQRCLRPAVHGEGSWAVGVELALTWQSGGNQDMQWSQVRGRAPAHLLCQCL